MWDLNKVGRVRRKKKGRTHLEFVATPQRLKKQHNDLPCSFENTGVVEVKIVVRQRRLCSLRVVNKDILGPSTLISLQ